MRILIIHFMVSLAKFAALKRAMKTTQRMPMELQGFAVTICTERSTADLNTIRLTCAGYSGEGDNISGKTYQPDFLNVRISPLKDNKEELNRLFWFGPLVVEFHHSRLEEEQTKIMKTQPPTETSSCVWAGSTSWRNSTASLRLPDVFTRDILTQVLNPPEKVHME